MHLTQLQLLNFKNHAEANLHFSSRINVLVGKNGSGKTNLLDAIYYLSLTKSAFSSSDHHCILHGQNYFMVKGKFQMNSVAKEIASSVQVGSKKVLLEDGLEYEKLSEHIGKYPVVLIAPDDVDLVREGSERRRKFFDSIISQLDKRYLEDLMQYNHALKQRNSLLKMFSERGNADWILLESFDQVLVKLGKAIFEKRDLFAKEFLPVFKKYFKFIVEDIEDTDLEYRSELKTKDFNKELISSRSKDLALQRTSFGIHRDDYQFSLGTSDLKRLGSQGQQKSFIIALKLAQFEIVRQNKGYKPILLLDDIFDKLDDFRIDRLLELIKLDLGQLFISDARPERTKGLLERIKVPAVVFTVNQGKVSPL